MSSNARSSISGEDQARDRFGTAYRVLEDAIEARAFPGCAFGVLAGGLAVLEGAVGRFTYEPWAPPVTTETVYDLASVTKVVATTAAAMLLAQRTELDLELPVGDLLPEFVAGRPSDDAGRRVTLRQLLAHRSGLPGYVEMFRTAATPEALLQECFHLKLEAEPGARAEYSDPGFILLGKALERVTGERLDAWCEREIFEPLAMGATRFCPPQAMRESIPPTEEDTTFRFRLIQGEVQDGNAYVLGGVAGHAGLFSKVSDLLRFSATILRMGLAGPNDESPARSLFDQDLVNRFAERQGPAGSSQAIGWDTPSEPSSTGHHFSRRSIGHLGYSGCSLWIDLDAAIAVVLLTNRTWPDRRSQMIKQVRPAFHDAIREALSNRF